MTESVWVAEWSELSKVNLNLLRGFVYVCMIPVLKLICGERLLVAGSVGI